MIKLIVVGIGISCGGALGWWIGASIGIMTGFFLSVLGASIGLFLSRQYCRNHLD